MLKPHNDVVDPEVSIVVPALNESLNIREFVEWALQGLSTIPVPGEVVIVDSSTDETPEIALAAGARVLRVPKRGLGRAYIDAIPHVRGRLVIMGDADCTYDFRDLRPFYEEYQDGAEYIMGSRFKGSIERGSMPPHHRYFGTPITTWILNRIFKSHFSDIHCGMRALTKDLLVRMNLQSQSWEYASEMVIKSVQMDARISEVPVTFLKDRNGRVSHHRREGWASPFKAAWINLRAMFSNGVDSFLVMPGALLMFLGGLLLFPLTIGDVSFGELVFSGTWQMFGAFTWVLGVSLYLLGANSRVLFDYTGRRSRLADRLFRFNRSMLTASLILIAGVGLTLPLVVQYFSSGLILDAHDVWRQRLATTGLATVVSSGLLVVNTFLADALKGALPRMRRE